MDVDFNQVLNDFIVQLPILGDMSPLARVTTIRLLALLLTLVLIFFLRLLLTRLVFIPVKAAVGRTSSQKDDAIFEAIQRPMRVVVLALGIAIISELFSFGEELDAFATNLTEALVIAAVMFFVYNLVGIVTIDSGTLKRITGIRLQERLLPFLTVVLKVFIVVMGLLIILESFEYDATGLVASFGVVGLAFSLAAQDTAANVFGFTAIVSDNPFKVGDYIVTDDFAGVVEHVGVRATRIRKLDQSLVTAPNSTLTDNAVTNWSRLSKRRVDFYIGVTYSTSAQQMRDLLERLREMLRQREKVDDESVVVHFVEFGDSALQIRVICYVFIEDWNEYTAESELINLAIMEIVEEMRLSMAFPSRSLYIETAQTPQERDMLARHVRPAEQQSAPSAVTPQAQDTPQGGQSAEKYQDNPSASSDADEGDER